MKHVDSKIGQDKRLFVDYNRCKDGIEIVCYEAINKDMKNIITIGMITETLTQEEFGKRQTRSFEEYPNNFSPFIPAEMAIKIAEYFVELGLVQDPNLFTEGELKATKDHLKDMRQIAFSKLEIEKC